MLNKRRMVNYWKKFRKVSVLLGSRKILCYLLMLTS